MRGGERLGERGNEWLRDCWFVCGCVHLQVCGGVGRGGIERAMCHALLN